MSPISMPDNTNEAESKSSSSEKTFEDLVGFNGLFEAFLLIVFSLLETDRTSLRGLQNFGVHQSH